MVKTARYDSMLAVAAWREPKPAHLQPAFRCLRPRLTPPRSPPEPLPLKSAFVPLTIPWCLVHPSVSSSVKWLHKRTSLVGSVRWGNELVHTGLSLPGVQEVLAQRK